MNFIVHWRILLLCLPVFFLQNHKISGQCKDHEQESLLQLKNGFSNFSTHSNIATWRPDIDCCKWEGISCNKDTGNVVSLDISDSFFIGDGVSSKAPISLNRLSSLQYLNMSRCYLTGDFPEQVFSFKNLTDLDLSDNPNLKVVIPELPQTSVLRSLKLSSTNVSWMSTASLSRLYSLRRLDVSRCHISGPLPYWISTFRNLVYLDISDNDLVGDIGSLHNLTELVHLDLSFNSFNGSIVSLQNLTKLVYLDLQSNDWFTGSIRSLQNLIKLVHLDLSGNWFTGSIYSLQNLTELVYLDLSVNRFNGSIVSLQNLTKLVRLKLFINTFTGSILSLQNLPELVYLNLGFNNFNGSILSLQNLPELVYLNLGFNNFNGSIPSLSNLTEFVTSSKLSYLYIGRNHLTGPIPKWIFQLKNLQILRLFSNNFSGTLDLQLFSNLQNLTGLDLSDNNLFLVNPRRNFTLQYFTKIQSLSLCNCKLNEFPSLTGRNGRLYSLDLSKNNISGKIPSWLWNAMSSPIHPVRLNLSHNSLEGFEETNYIISSINFENLDLSNNQLLGEISDILGANLNQAEYITVANNRFFGKIPETICNSQSLRMFDLSHNELSGIIPQCIGELTTHLIILNLKHNNFRGKMPQSYGKDCRLKTLNLNGNQLEGNIPRSLVNCRELVILDIGNNRLSDTFPFWLHSLSFLRILVLRSNRFYGEISSNMNYSFPSLQIMDVSSNNFIGTISLKCLQGLKTTSKKDSSTKIIEIPIGLDSYYRENVTLVVKGKELNYQNIIIGLTTAIDLSNNSFQGEIPKDIGEFSLLMLLNISWNRLTGPIPQAIGNLTQLESLDLSKNHLSGRIPFQLTSLTYLSKLNLSGNNLEGRIPEGNQFNTFNEESFLENPRLCGSPLPVKCSENSPSELSPVKVSLVSFIETIWFTFIFGFVPGLIIGVLFWNILPKKRHKTHVNRG